MQSIEETYSKLLTEGGVTEDFLKVQNKITKMQSHLYLLQIQLLETIYSSHANIW